jgi:hypothetical protein
VFVARVSIPDLVAAAVQACDELAGLLEELDQWVNDKLANLLEAVGCVRSDVASELPVRSIMAR